MNIRDLKGLQKIAVPVTSLSSPSEMEPGALYSFCLFLTFI